MIISLFIYAVMVMITFHKYSKMIMDERPELYNEMSVLFYSLITAPFFIVLLTYNWLCLINRKVTWLIKMRRLHRDFMQWLDELKEDEKNRDKKKK
jgi:hypothetical protein